MNIKVNHNSVEVVQGDIADQDTEAIVNAANNLLWMGAGVAGAIKRKGGELIEREAVDQGPIEIGEVVLTSAGSLKANYVIHAAVMGQDLHTNADYITKATRNVLRLGEEKSIASISFPALGTGVGGFSVFHCAKIMITEAIDFLMKSKHLRHICFVLFDKQTFDAFEQELKLQLSSKRH
ncbi:MAG: macro domain-containing protein [Ignavibacteria bacterium]|nr:macro domain-containing protein [Ignavibacteria bacterium]